MITIVVSAGRSIVSYSGLDGHEVGAELGLGRGVRAGRRLGIRRRGQCGEVPVRSHERRGVDLASSGMATRRSMVGAVGLPVGRLVPLGCEVEVDHIVGTRPQRCIDVIMVQGLARCCPSRGPASSLSSQTTWLTDAL